MLKPLQDSRVRPEILKSQKRFGGCYRIRRQVSGQANIVAVVPAAFLAGMLEQEALSLAGCVFQSWLTSLAGGLDGNERVAGRFHPMETAGSPWPSARVVERGRSLDDVDEHFPKRLRVKLRTIAY